MATKRPLYLDENNDVGVVRSVDLVSPSSLGSGVADATSFLRGDSSWVVSQAKLLRSTLFAVDFGTIPRTSHTFVATFAGVAPDDYLLVLPAGSTDGQAELERINYTATCETPGIVKVAATSEFGVTGIRNLYLLRSYSSLVTNILQKTLFVSPTGNDSTASAGNLTKPWATVSAALAASSAGDTICLLPGKHYASGVLRLKNGSSIVPWVKGPENTELVLDGMLGFLNNSNPTANIDIQGGHLQPSLGISGVDACFIKGIKITMGLGPLKIAVLCGVNTGANGNYVGSGASFADMYFEDCVINTICSLHVVIDAQQHTYFKRCQIRHAYFVTWMYGNLKTPSLTFQNCRVSLRPFYQTSPTLVGVTPQLEAIVNKGTLRFINSEYVVDYDATVYNNLIFKGSCNGLLIDDNPGAVLVLEGFRRRVKNPLPYFSSGIASSSSNATLSRGTVITDGTSDGLISYNSSGPFSSPIRILPRTNTVLKTLIFGSINDSTTLNNTFRLSASSGNTQLFRLFVLPPNVAVKRVWIDVRAAFGADFGVSNVSISVGIESNVIKYIEDRSIVGASGAVLGITNGLATYNAVESTGDFFTGTGTMVVAQLTTVGLPPNYVIRGQVLVYVELGGAAI